MATILIADDEADIRGLLSITLSRRGHTVLQAETGPAALSLVEQIVPDLAILDVNLPGIEGTQIARRMRANPATASVPIMILTALSNEADTLAGFAAGADDYVTKPFNPRQLAARVQALLARGGTSAGPLARAQGRLIAVTGPKGGCGRTMIAVNMALAAVKTGAGAGDALLLDGHLTHGDVDVHLDLRSTTTIRDLVPYTGHVDVAALQSALVRHHSGLRVLLRPRAAGEAELISSSLWEEILQIATAIGETVIVDLGPGYEDDRTLATLEAASLVLLVTTPDVSALRSARQFLTLAPRLGVERRRARVVLNRAHPQSGLSAKDAADALGIKISELEQLPDVGAVGMSYVNRGIPVLDADPNLPLARALGRLAEILVPSADARRVA
ncbi:MAG: response regulator [Chloroflexota bacterium]|nr:response regulator [Chloroflexota bacterium]